MDDTMWKTSFRLDPCSQSVALAKRWWMASELRFPAPMAEISGFYPSWHLIVISFQLAEENNTKKILKVRKIVCHWGHLSSLRLHLCVFCPNDDFHATAPLSPNKFSIHEQNTNPRYREGEVENAFLLANLHFQPKQPVFIMHIVATMTAWQHGGSWRIPVRITSRGKQFLFRFYRRVTNFGICGFLNIVCGIKSLSAVYTVNNMIHGVL